MGAGRVAGKGDRRRSRARARRYRCGRPDRGPGRHAPRRRNGRRCRAPRSRPHRRRVRRRRLHGLHRPRVGRAACERAAVRRAPGADRSPRPVRRPRVASALRGRARQAADDHGPLELCALEGGARPRLPRAARPRRRRTDRDPGRAFRPAARGRRVDASGRGPGRREDRRHALTPAASERDEGLQIFPRCFHFA